MIGAIKIRNIIVKTENTTNKRVLDLTVKTIHPKQKSTKKVNLCQLIKFT